MISEDVIRVHLENPESISIQKTEEKEPEHFTFTCHVIAAATGYDTYYQVLAEDPNRKDWSIWTADQPIVICHSVAQAANPANQVATVINPPQGSLLTTGQSVSFSGTGPVWVAATSVTPTRVSIAVNRRGSA